MSAEREPLWVPLEGGLQWDSWLSAQGSGLVVGGSGVTFTGRLAGVVVCRCYDGREWRKNVNPYTDTSGVTMYPPGSGDAAIRFLSRYLR